MNISIKRILAIGLLLLVPVLKDAKAQSPVQNDSKPDAKIPFSMPRIPIGIYALVPVEDVVEAQAEAAKSQGKGITLAGMNLYLTSDFYPSLLNNHAVAGLAIQIQWATLNPEAGSYFWDYVDDAFSSVATWNTEHPKDTQRTIQLIVTPGFLSPQWVLSDLTSCDGLFNPFLPPATADCGKVTFTVFREQNQADGNAVLPAPWNKTYQSDWSTFLAVLAARYDTNPSFVSISVAGPTAASVEMIMPSGTTNDEAFGTKLTTMASANDVWEGLFVNAGLLYFPNSDEPFIIAWDDAVTAYGEIFSGVTLVETTGSGLPNLGTGKGFTPPSPFGPDCMGKGGDNQDCQTETTILSNFVVGTAGGPNGKATQTSGLEASSVGKDLGIAGVKFLSQLTMGEPSSSTRILGGAQFAMSVSKQPNNEGSSPMRVQALYNVLAVYFDQTPVAGSKEFFGGTTDTKPLNYLQVNYQDIQYGTQNKTIETITEADGKPANETFQDLLNLAKDDLAEIAESEP
jgi:hypothetical protein